MREAADNSGTASLLAAPTARNVEGAWLRCSIPRSPIRAYDTSFPSRRLGTPSIPSQEKRKKQCGQR
jgi:hypothetical protein